jgi:putative DNA primase/helicase
MREPASVVRATGDYQADSDAVRRFIAEACETGPHVHAMTRELYGAWQRRALSDGAEAMSERAFAKELDRLGYEGRKTRAGAVRAGLTLPAEDALAEGW